MAQLSVAQNSHAEKTNELTTASGTKGQGILKAGGEEHTVFPVADSEAVTEAADQFLQEANSKKADPETLQKHEFTHITPELVDVEQEILELQNELAKMETAQEGKNEKPRFSPDGKPIVDRQSQNFDGKQLNQQKSLQNSPSAQTSAEGRPEQVYSSLFSLARSFHSSLNEAQKKEQKNPAESQERTQAREEARPQLASPSTAHQIERAMQNQENRFDREGDGKQERDGQEEEKEGSSQHQNQQQQEQQQKKKKGIISIKELQAAKTESPKTALQAEGDEANKGPTARETLGSVENIYIRFMALMARILGQAEREAHDLYLRIKERTDNVDTLTLLLQKINSEKKGIDWSKDEEMKQLIDKAREIGVDIPKDKYKWSEDEKKLLKENIQMRKDSMEKMTQLERTDMQRYLQEASQCHQARSNVLKLLKEVIDTIIHNMRGG